MASPSPQVGKGLLLSSVCEALGRVSSKWFKIGIQLGIPHNKLMEFKKEDDPLSAVVHYWLSGNVTESVVPISWKSIVEILKSEYVGEAGYAEELKMKYCPEDDTTETEDTSKTEDNDGDDGSSSSDSTDVELDLEQQLDLNRRDIEKQYAFYVASIQSIVEKNGITAKSLSSFLFNLVSSTADEKKKLMLLANLEAELKNIEHIADIFMLLSCKYASFLNPDVYVSILEMFGSQEEQKKLNYPERLKNFVQRHTIKEFCEMYPKLVGPKLTSDYFEKMSRHCF